MLDLVQHSRSLGETFWSPTGRQVLGFSIVAVLGVPSLITRLLALHAREPLSTSKYQKPRNEPPTERSVQPLGRVCAVSSGLGTASAAIIALWTTFTYKASWNISGTWVILAGQVGMTLIEKDPRQRFLLGLRGALSSAILVLLCLIEYVSDREIEPDPTSRLSRAAGVLAATSTLLGFLSIPQRPQKFFQGKLVDRQLSSTLLERATFSWGGAIFDPDVISKSGVADLPALDLETRADRLTRQHVRCAASHPRRRLAAVLVRSHMWSLAAQWTVSILKSIVALAPQLVKLRLLQRLTTPRPEKVQGADFQGLFLALALGLSKVSELWVDELLCWITESRLGIPIRATLSSLTYRKALSLPSIMGGAGESSQKSYRLSNLRMHSATASMTFTRSNKVLLATTKPVSTMIFLASLVGWKALMLALAASAVSMPILTRLLDKHGRLHSDMLKHRDRRNGFLIDALRSIRQIKLSAAEVAWVAKILDSRDQQLTQLFKSGVWMCIYVFAANVGPIFLAGVPIFVFALQGKQLSTSVAFTCIELFRQLQSDISVLPIIFTHLFEAWTSLRHVETYFAEPEVATMRTAPSSTVAFREAAVGWLSANEGREPFTLRDLSIEFPEGQLSIVTGDTGSGKSLLLSAIAGEAALLSGSIHSPQSGEFDIQAGDKNEPEGWILSHHVAIVSQSAWMENTTVRNNILFGLPLDEDRYRTAIKSCALENDLAVLKDGDLTRVGAKGVALSGGQRWRVALARALYSRAGLLLLDDVLSAVDAEVREWLVEEALMGSLAKGRTRILATHHPSQCRERAAYIVRLGGGRVEHQGALSPIPFPGRAELGVSNTDVQRLNLGDFGPNEKTNTGPVVANVDVSSHPAIHPGRTKPAERAIAKVEKKPKQKRHDRWAPYKTYFHATGGIPSWLLVLAATTTYEFLGYASSWWLKEWTSDSVPSDTSPSRLLFVASSTRDTSRIWFYGATYMLLSCLRCLATAGRSFVWYILGLTASTKLFGQMTRSVFGSPLHWLETTSHGEIVSRFTSDTNPVDLSLPHNMGNLIECFCQVVSILFTSMAVSPFAVWVAAALLFVYYRIGVRLIFATQSLNKISSAASASFYQHLGSLEAPDGLLTIRAYGMRGHFMERMFRLIDNTSSAAWHQCLCFAMINFRLGILGALFLTTVAIGAVLTRVDAGTAGIALSFAERFSDAMSVLLGRVATVEAGLHSAERMAEYGELPQEPRTGVDPPPDWPSDGRIDVRQLVAGYHAGSMDDEFSAVLKSISFSVRPGERVGIVGRTGAGKSSLTMAFLRLLPLQEGQILIDGLDISTVKLHALRQQVFVIPQDPYLFAGSIRSTLDPNNSHDDETIMAALERVRFRCTTSWPSDPAAARTTGDAVPEQSTSFKNLSFALNEGGTNISQGQRQMLYLARALLSRSKRLVIMDEATSAVDGATDAAIQDALRAGLPDATVLVVAHRLATVAEFDKVLVLDGGELVECGSRAELLRRRGSFWRLVCHSSDREGIAKRILGDSCITDDLFET